MNGICPLLAVLVAANAGPDAKALNAEATRAFKRGDYARACDGFAKAAALAGDNGTYWADAGLCWAKLGKKKEAVAVNLRAAASQDETARLHAYYNLGKLGHLHPLPALGGTMEDIGEKCDRLEGDAACKEGALLVCRLRRRDPSSGNCVQMYDETLVIGRTEADVRGCPALTGEPPAEEGVPPSCPGLMRFPLEREETGCCHAGYSDCGDGGYEDIKYPAPRVVFVDPCAGRVGYLLRSGKALEATLGTSSRPAISYLLGGTGGPAGIDLALDEVASGDREIRLEGYRTLAKQGVELAIPQARGKSGIRCAPLRASCGTAPGGAESVLYACLRVEGASERLAFSRRPELKDSDFAPAGAKDTGNEPAAPRIGPFGLTTPGAGDPPFLARESLVFADACAGRIGISDGKTAREETLAASWRR